MWTMRPAVLITTPNSKNPVLLAPTCHFFDLGVVRKTKCPQIAQYVEVAGMRYRRPRLYVVSDPSQLHTAIYRTAIVIALEALTSQ